MRLGRDRIAEHADLFAGKRIGLVTQHAGEAVASGIDPRTRLPVRSLYGATRRPTDEMLRDIEVMVYDI